jgi:hypothetical protein
LIGELKTEKLEEARRKALPTFDRLIVKRNGNEANNFPNKILSQFNVKALENLKIAKRKAQKCYAIGTDGSGLRQQ